jgi:outer membrane protein insertion porin family
MRNQSSFRLGLLLCSGLALCVGTAPARAFMPPAAAPQAPAAVAEQFTTIDDIRIEGIQRLEAETVLSYLSLSKCDEASPDKLDEALKSLYATGLFSDVQLSLQGRTLMVKIAENPVLNRVAFEGNDAISKEDLEKEVQIGRAHV